FVRSIREEVSRSGDSLREAKAAPRCRRVSVAHYHRERNHQGLGNELIAPKSDPRAGTKVRCQASRRTVGAVLFLGAAASVKFAPSSCQPARTSPSVPAVVPTACMTVTIAPAGSAISAVIAVEAC